jgi:hypothetical protein
MFLLCACLAAQAGCDFYTSATRATFDANATYSRNIADAAAKGVKPDGAAMTPADSAYYLECFARTFQNLSDAGHWRPPTFPKAPTSRPTTIPWDNRQ